VEVAKPTHENVIGVEGTMIAIVQVLGYGEKFGTLDPYFLGGNFDIATLAHLTISDTKGSINNYPHQKQVLFTFSNVARTTIANKRNWNCDTMTIREAV